MFRALEVTRKVLVPLTLTLHGCRFPDTPQLFLMKSIPVLTLYDRIVSNMHRDYLLQKSLQLRQETDAAYKSISKYREDKHQFNDLINAPRPKLKRPVQVK
jgi:hypothetical protein